MLGAKGTQIKLGAQLRQPLGFWPISVSGLAPSAGAATTPTAVATNSQQSTTYVSSSGGSSAIAPIDRASRAGKNLA